MGISLQKESVININIRKNNTFTQDRSVVPLTGLMYNTFDIYKYWKEYSSFDCEHKKLFLFYEMQYSNTNSLNDNIDD